MDEALKSKVYDRVVGPLNQISEQDLTKAERSQAIDILKADGNCRTPT